MGNKLPSWRLYNSSNVPNSGNSPGSTLHHPGSCKPGQIQTLRPAASAGSFLCYSSVLIAATWNKKMPGHCV